MPPKLPDIDRQHNLWPPSSNEIILSVLADMSPLLKESSEVENPNNLDQDHNRYADTDEDFHVAPWLPSKVCKIYRLRYE